MLGNGMNVILDQFDTLERCGLGYLAKNLTFSVNTEAPENAYEILANITQKYQFTHSLQNIS
jgi:hypothetical protein